MGLAYVGTPPLGIHCTMIVNLPPIADLF